MFGINTQTMDKHTGPRAFSLDQAVESASELSDDGANIFADMPVIEALGVLVVSPCGDTLEMAGRDLCSTGMTIEPGRWTMQQLWPEGQPGPGEKLTMRVLLPFGPYGGSYELEVTCRVIQQLRLSERRFEISLTFESMPETSRRTLSDYLAEETTQTGH